MNKKNNNYIIIFSVLFLAIILMSVWYIMWSKWTDTAITNVDALNTKDKDDVIKKESDKYLKNVKKIDYSLTYNWFKLDEYKDNKDIIFSSGNLVIKWKTMTWEHLQLIDETLIKKDWKYIFSRLANQDIDTIIWTWITDTKTKQIDVSKTGSWSNTPQYITYEIKFIKWFTKMKLKWKYYQFDESNLNYWTKFDFELFLTWNKAYVISFENCKEKQNRQNLLNELEKKVDEIKKKYWKDPYVTNTLIDKLNKEYNIDINNY